MQELERKLYATRDASPTRRIGATISPERDAIEFRALSLCEHCGAEIALDAGFLHSEWGWYAGDYNRAQAYADAAAPVPHAQHVCSFEIE